MGDVEPRVGMRVEYRRIPGHKPQYPFQAGFVLPIPVPPQRPTVKP
jgi:hypothetical protein